MLVDETVWHYLLAAPTAQSQWLNSDVRPRLTLDRTNDVARCMQLYHDIGRPYWWNNQRDWSVDRWRLHVGEDNRRCWLVKVDDECAGLVEVVAHSDGAVEITDLGLLPPFVGRGIGRHLLAAVLDEAWRVGPGPVRLHTSSLDDVRARPTYERAGFVLTRIEQKRREIPSQAEATRP